MNYNNWILPIILLILFGGFYIGQKLQSLINIQKTKKQKIIYWTILFFIITSIILTRNILAITLFYLILFHLIFDFAKLIAYLLKQKTLQNFLNRIYYKGIPILIMCFLITIYGLYNVNHPLIKHYDLKSTKKLPNNLSLGLISDLHLNYHSEKILNQIVQHANQLNVDLFILCGDIFDEFTKEETKEQAIQKLSEIKTKYGIYYIEGNHDLFTPQLKQILKSNQIQALDDVVTIISNQINLIGRKDYRNNKLGNKRKELKELMQDCNQELPIILVDHQPIEQKEAEKLGVDLQLSGHTHAGQLFPINFLLPYGYHQKNNYQIIVSSGYGVWGFPIRTAGRNEMIHINISN